MMASRIKEEAVLRDLLRWIETRDFNMTRRQMMPEAQEEAESEESVRWLSYILDNDEAESGKWVQCPILQTLKMIFFLSRKLQ